MIQPLGFSPRSQLRRGAGTWRRGREERGGHTPPDAPCPGQACRQRWRPPKRPPKCPDTSERGVIPPHRPGPASGDAGCALWTGSRTMHPPRSSVRVTHPSQTTSRRCTSHTQHPYRGEICCPPAPPCHLEAPLHNRGSHIPISVPVWSWSPQGPPPQAPQEPGCSHGPRGSQAPQASLQLPVESPPLYGGIQPPNPSLPLPRQPLSHPEPPAPAAAVHPSPGEPRGGGSREKTSPDFIKSSAPVNTIKKKSNCASREVLN